jgi:putative Mg2+ transporter-C (MgtC) family protein
MASLDPADWFSIFTRISLAILVGGIVGLERQIDRKPAGLRTHMLVSLGSALFVMTSLQLGTHGDDNTSRVIQGIVSGIGFLGAGEIFSKFRSAADVKIQGLTSAAAIWVSASLGVAAGSGLGVMALTGAIATLIILKVVKAAERSIDREDS